MALVQGVSLDAYLKAIAAVVALTLALVVMSVSRGRGSGPFLGAFLLLIAGNQTCETLRALASDEATRAFWFRIATVFAALDPFALALAMNAASGRRLVGTRGLATILAIGSVFAGFAVFALPLEGPPGGIRYLGPQAWQDLYSMALGLYTFVIYLALLIIFLRKSDRSEARAFVAGALALAAIPLAPPIAGAKLVGLFVGHRFVGLVTEVVLGTAIALVATIVVLRIVWRSEDSPHAIRAAGGLTLGALVVALVLNIDALAKAVSIATTGAETDAFVILGRSAAPIRWFLFSALFSVVVLRFAEVPATLRERRTAARVLITLAILVVLGMALALFQTIAGARPIEVRPIEAFLLVAFILASQAFWRLVDVVAAKVYGVPPVASAFERERARVDVGELVGGRYRVQALLGKGGAGRVFLAKDEVVRRQVVLKELHRDRSPGDDIHEARVAGAVAHPNVVALYDVLPIAGRSILVQEYVDGGTLHDLISQEAQVTSERAAYIIAGILAGLAHVHQGGVVHGDVKPSNVLLTRDGRPKLADFGIARFSTGETIDFSGGGIFQGTPEFCAPEQLRGARPTSRTDVYSVGVIARRILGGDPPAAIQKTIDRALASDPGARWPDAGAMLEEWRAACQSMSGLSQ